MVIALLVILGVDLIVLVVSLAFVLARNRRATRQPAVSHCPIHVTNGTVEGFRPQWTRGYGRRVRAVLVWTKAPFLFRNELISIDRVGEHRSATPGDVKRLGSDPIIGGRKTGTATVEIPAHSDDLNRVPGPFRPAKAGHV
jgi:hypothetical protein